jgi:TPR repeat protein
MITMKFLLTLILLAPASLGSQELKPQAVQDQYRQAMSLLLAGNPNASDRDQALTLLRAAASRDYAPAETALGTIYEQGILITKEASQAILFYRKAADQGDWIAQFSLGRIYFLGLGTATDTTAAKKWFTQAAGAGDSGSAFFLGLLNDHDLGNPPDYVDAARWYRFAAERGNPFAQERLARLLLEGRGVKQNRQEGYAWLLMAVEFGNRQAQAKLDSMEGDLGKSGADAARKQALEMRDRILGYTRTDCAGWDGQYGESPTAPPLSSQLSCQHIK